MSGRVAPVGRRAPVAVAREAAALLAEPVVAILLALVVGGVLIVLFSGLLPNHPAFDVSLPFAAYWALFTSAIASFDGITSTLVYSTPLILAGLGVGLGFKAGLFNIGGRGQFLMGGVGAMAVATVGGSGMPGVVAIPLALLAGMAAGAAAGFIPGFLKAVSGAHEVVTTIMLNYVFVFLLYWAVSGPLMLPHSPQPITINIKDSTHAALPIILGRDANIGILIALLAVPIIWFLLYRTTLGFEIRASGANPDAARYGGMRPARIIVLTMTLSGLLVGLAGACTLLGVVYQMSPGYDTTVGFDAITVALLGRSNPVGILFAGLLLGGMRAGAPAMNIQAGVPPELVDALQAIILLFLVVNVLRRVLGARAGRGTEITGLETVTKTYGTKSV